MYKRLFEEARRHSWRLRNPADNRLPGARRGGSWNDHLCRNARLHAAVALRNRRRCGPRCSRRQEHERIFGRSRRGCGCRVRLLPGLDEVWRRRGSLLRWWIARHRALDPRRCWGGGPLYCPRAWRRSAGTRRVELVGSSIGYPADFNYGVLPRHRLRRGHGLLGAVPVRQGSARNGDQYRITGASEHKALTTRWAGTRRRAREGLRGPLAATGRRAGRTGRSQVFVSPYDAELFGHWWFEGPQWIYKSSAR